MLTNSKSDEVPWAYLPPTVVIEILSYLPQSDRLHAITVFLNWQPAFHSPELWTAAVIQFEGKESQPTEVTDEYYRGPRTKRKMLLTFRNEKAILFAESNGRYLKDLWFKVYLGTEEMMEDEYSNLMTMMKRFFTKLAENECRLQKMQIDCDLLSSNWKLDIKDAFIYLWTKFLRSQTQLKTVIFQCWWQSIVTLMGSLLEGNGASLQSLKFSIELEDVSPEAENQESYLSLFAKMPKLQTLEMPCECFNDMVFSNLLIYNSALKCINLDCGSTPLDLLFPSHLGSPSPQMQMAAKRYPGFKLKMCFGSLVALGCVCFVLSFLTSPTSVRDVRISIDVYVDVSRREVHNMRLFNYFGNLFSQRLETFNYSDFRPTSMEESTPYIKQLVLSSPKLKNLNVYIFKDEPISYIEEICQMQVDNKIDIKNLYIEYYSCNIEDEEKLNNIFQLYKGQLGNRNWKFHFTYKCLIC